MSILFVSILFVLFFLVILVVVGLILSSKSSKSRREGISSGSTSSAIYGRMFGQHGDFSAGTGTGDSSSGGDFTSSAGDCGGASSGGNFSSGTGDCSGASSSDFGGGGY
jgi:hypothetical protein